LTGESEAVPAAIESTDKNFLETANIGLQGTLCVGGSGMGTPFLYSASVLGLMISKVL